MDSSLEERAREILLRAYSRILAPQDEGGFTGEILEFPGCFAEGNTADEVYANLQAAAESWLIACFETGERIPEPLGEYEGSGKFALRRRVPRRPGAASTEAAPGPNPRI